MSHWGRRPAWTSVVFPSTWIIGRCEHLVERVVLARLHMAQGEREQVQIVVAEDDHGAVSEVSHEAQGGERSGAAVDEIAHEPEPVARAIETERPEQRLQLVEAALNVADRVGGHLSVGSSPGPPGYSSCTMPLRRMNAAQPSRSFFRSAANCPGLSNTGTRA